jgi:hypothetical protein
MRFRFCRTEACSPLDALEEIERLAIARIADGVDADLEARLHHVRHEPGRSRRTRR